MYIFKFGGGVITNAENIQKMTTIIMDYEKKYPLVVVVSALDKTTTLLEKIAYSCFNNLPYQKLLDSCYNFHYNIIKALFSPNHIIFSLLYAWKNALLQDIKNKISFYKLYNNLVAYGEILASNIIFHYLLEQKLCFQQVDSRKTIETLTNSNKLNFLRTKKKIQIFVQKKKAKHVLTQGFISSDSHGEITNLGKEGSDYTAAIWAAVLQAQGLVFWKNVPGVMTDDPKKNPRAHLLQDITYSEVHDMVTHGGDKILHPSTVPLLSQHNVPLYFKNFHDPQQIATTTIVGGKKNSPIFRIKRNIFWLTLKKKQQKLYKKFLENFFFTQSIDIVPYMYQEINTKIWLALVPKFDCIDIFCVIQNKNLQNNFDVIDIQKAHLCISNYVDNKKTNHYLSKNNILYRMNNHGWSKIVFK